MAERGVNLSPIKWLGLVITIIAVTNITIILDIPVLRQISGFIFLTFIPGFLLLFILKLNKLGLVEKIVLSVGLSVAFSMLFGLLVNSLLLALGYTKPLSTIPLLISFSIATIILAAIAYIRNKGITFSFSNFKLTTREKAFLIVPALFLLLSIVGTRLMNLTDNNVLLMLLLFLISAYVIFISFSNRRVSERVYPAVIFLISISLLLMYSLRSNHLIGADTHLEYFMFLTTLDNFHWGELGFFNLDSLLSISMLPAIYQIFLNIDPEYLFKLLYSVIVSILPLVVYILSKKYIGSFYAFLASVFFMSQIIFLWTPSAARVNIAILFFGLAIMVIFHNGISGFSKRALFIVFAASIIMSHYGTTYVSFLVLLFTWIGMQILARIVSRRKEVATLSAGSYTPKKNPPVLPPQGESPPGYDALAYRAAALESSQTQRKRGITIAFLALFLAMLFFWYSQMTGPTFTYGVQFIYETFTSWSEFFGIEFREYTVQSALGRTLPYAEIPQTIEFVFSWLTIIFIAIGVLATISRFKGMVSITDSGHRKSNFLLKKFDAEYLVLAIICCALLVMAAVLPHISRDYGMSRTYLQMMIPLSIFFVIGGIVASKYLKSRPYWVILVVLIPYFLCTTGAMSQLFSFPRNITLNSEGTLYEDMYVSDEESYAAKWIKEYGGGTRIYTGAWPGPRVLLSQGKIPRWRTLLSFISQYQEGKKIDGYLYLRHTDITVGRVVTEYPDLFARKSKLYTTGGSAVYR